MLKKLPDGKCNIGFSVKDNGNCISKKDLSYIMDPLHSGEQADEKLGVGLSLANSLVKLFKSELNVKSEKGVGSHFDFLIGFNESNGSAYKMMPKKKSSSSFT